MKTNCTYIKYLVIPLILLYFNEISASNIAYHEYQAPDSIRVSLLTCSPHDEIYSLYGHTAIRYEDESKGIDIAINYGVFSFKQPYFALRFILGKTDYQIGIEDFEDFCNEYRAYGSSIKQQAINLTTEEKNRFLKALTENCSEENRTYRYNYLYNNCTTKARDLIASSIDGKIVYKNEIDDSHSFRDIIHTCNTEHRWARFGNDILLGVNVDKNTSRQDQQFLPANLSRDFSHAYIRTSNGLERPLVIKTETILNASPNKVSESILTPTTVSLVLLILSISLCITERVKRKKYVLTDAALQVFLGCIGILLFIMIFSQHPATSINFQILLFNPILLYIAFKIIRNRKENKKLKSLYFVSVILMALATLGSFVQTYAEGVTILALSLLLRYLYNYAILVQEQKKKNHNEQ